MKTHFPPLHSPQAAVQSGSVATRVHRVEVRTKPGLLDPRADVAASKARRLGYNVERASSARVYLIEAPLSDEQLKRVMHKLLADPVVESASVGVAPAAGVTIEVHPLPGVMDPAAQSVREAIVDLTGVPADAAQVSTGVRYDLTGLTPEQSHRLGKSALGNPAIHQILTHAWMPEELPKGHAYAFKLVTVPVRSLDDAGLMKLSKDGHLFLNLQEMQAIRSHFQKLGRDATDIELETLAQTWSEHCVHKTLKARVRYVEDASTSAREGQAAMSLLDIARPGFTRDADGALIIDNLLKRTVAAATHELISEGVDWTLSVFKDNSGVIAFDEQWGVCIKVETHNRPSAIEPYGGAATGIGGCIRDVIGTGLGAKPIASTDVFCVANPSNWHESSESASRGQGVTSSLPPGVLHPRRVLTDVVAGVRDYGNRMGIPTITGGVFFDDRYVGNPLVFCGCIGLIPRHLVHGKVQAGDRIIALGGRTGRDGIHGATFSSGELQSTSATEFSHAVQIGNAIEEKRVLDVIMRAREAAGGKPLYTAMTDCGAGGFSSAVGEMGSKLGARVTLENAPLKYAGLRYDEIWISEAQERMVLSVPAANVRALRRICDEEGVELCDLGEFGTPGSELILTYHGHEVGRLAMDFIHDGLPNPTREAVWGASEAKTHARNIALSQSVASSLLAVLSHPTVSSKHWIIRQYDHEVQGASVLKPLVGPLSRGPGDASVITPVPGSSRGVALSQGLQNPFGDVSIGGDPYWMTLASIDECVRNLVCVGADPTRIAILDNFCWASCEKRENLGALVRAAVACYDGAKAYRTPFVSGKDSLSNQLRYTDPATGEARLIEIPPTLLITGMAIVADVSRCVSMDAKQPGNVLLLVGETTGKLGGSMVQALHGLAVSEMPRVDLVKGPATAKLVASLIARGLVTSAHDCSEGGVLTAVAEMLIAGDDPRADAGATGRIGAELSPVLRGGASQLPPLAFAFCENHSRYVLEVEPSQVSAITEASRQAGVHVERLGVLNASGRLSWREAEVDVPVPELAHAWLRALDW